LKVIIEMFMPQGGLVIATGNGNIAAEIAKKYGAVNIAVVNINV